MSNVFDEDKVGEVLDVERGMCDCEGRGAVMGRWPRGGSRGQVF